jgi:ribosomal protein S9
MNSPKPYNEVDEHIATFTPEELHELAAATAALDLGMLLHQAREARGLSQAAAAQLAISKPLAALPDNCAKPACKQPRLVFVFDPRRCAILLLGGNKARQWQAWYKRNIPVAEALYAQHLRELEKEGLL